MKRWLTISLVLNLGLLALLLGERRPAGNPTATEKTELVRVANSQNAAALPAPEVTPVKAVKTADVSSWLDELRVAGVPNRILASVVIADFENRWDVKERELQQKYDSGEVGASAMTQAEDERVAEREKALRTALGEAGFRQWDKENTLHDLNLGSVKLSDAESDSLYQSRKDLLQTQHELERESHSGKIDDADMSRKLSAAQAQYDAQARALLGDERYAAMNNTPDPVSADLRRKTKDLNPTDDQLTSLLDAQKQWNEQRTTLEHQLESSQVTPEQHDAQMQALNAARDQAYQSALGTNGFAEFQKSQDPNYQTMKHYSAAWQLSDTDIDYLYKTLQYYQASVTTYEQQAQALQNQGQSVDWTNVQESISQFSGQVGHTLENYLGDDRFKKLQQNNIFTFGN